MSTTVYEYRIYCQTEAAWQNVYSKTVPTVCPNNNTHTVTANSAQKLKKIGQDVVEILEEKPPIGALPTGGNYAATVLCLDIPAGVTAGETTSGNLTFPYPIGLIDVHFTTTDSMEGDILRADVAPNTIIGTIAEDVPLGITCTTAGFTVSDTVIANIEVGNYITLYDGVNTNELDECLDIGVSNVITVKTATTNAFSAASPTYVRMTSKMLRNFIIGPAQTYRLGMNTVGASYIPKDIIGKFTYENWEMSAKKLYIYFEFFY